MSPRKSVSDSMMEVGGGLGRPPAPPRASPEERRVTEEGGVEGEVQGDVQAEAESQRRFSEGNEKQGAGGQGEHKATQPGVGLVNRPHQSARLSLLMDEVEHQLVDYDQVRNPRTTRPTHPNSTHTLTRPLFSTIHDLRPSLTQCRRRPRRWRS